MDTIYKKLRASESPEVVPFKSFIAPTLRVVPFFSIDLMELDFEINRLATVTIEVRNRAEAITKRVTISVEASL